MRDAAQITPGLVNVASPVDGVITGGQPDEEHLRRLAEAGYRTVIDLRTREEDRGIDEPGEVRRAGMEYVSLPVAHDTVEGETCERFRELMRDADRRPALVHCASANRVGALMVPYLILDEGKTREEALRIARRVGLRSNDLKQAALRYARYASGG